MRVLRHVSTMLLVAASLVGGQPAAAAESSPEGWTDRLIVGYAPRASVSLPLGVRIVRSSTSQTVVELPRRATPSDLRRFTDPNILYVEPDRRLTRAVAPNDPRFPEQWDISDAAAGASDFSVKAPGAWEITTGDPDLVVAVLDTGLAAHSELTGRSVAGYDMVGDTVISNDGDGRDGDASDPGDWVTLAESETPDFAGCYPSSSSWHGTHVAGTIAATGNNGQGIAGLNWHSKIQPVRVLGKCGGYTSDIADGIRWAAGGTVSGVPANPTPARIINLSLGGYGSCSSTMQNAINDARSRGALVVVAAGNSALNAAWFEPANCSGVITVAATDRDGLRAYYSNYGAAVDIAAPGGDGYVDTLILSTLNSGTQGPVAESYEAYEGTSMAAPHVAGVLSLLLSHDPYLTESETLAIMADTATDFPSGGSAYHCTSTFYRCGAGIINATAALQAAAAMDDGQAITLPVQVTRYVGEAPFAPGATASSELTVSYSAAPSGVCTTDGALISLVGRGTCTITALQAGGSGYRAAASVSAAFSVVSGIRPAISVDVAFSTAPVVGTLSTPTLGSWAGGPTPSVAYQWMSCTRSGSATTATRAPSGCTAISGAVDTTYTPQPSDAGRFLRMRQVATNLAGSTTRFSATSPLVQSPPVAVSAPVASGTPRPGRTLTARVGTFRGTAPFTYAYQWFSCTTRTAASPSQPENCTAIEGSTTATLLVTSSQIGRYLAVRVTATNVHGSATMFGQATIAVR